MEIHKFIISFADITCYISLSYDSKIYMLFIMNPTSNRLSQDVFIDLVEP